MKRRLAVESLEPKCLLAGLVVQGTEGPDVFEFSPGSVWVNGVEQTYDPAEYATVTIDGLAGAATESVGLTGSLSQTGEVATVARRIQTDILGDGSYSAPSDSGTVSLAVAPAVSQVTTANRAGTTTFTAGDTYQYKLVWGDDYTLGSANPSESRPSDTFSHTVAADGDEVLLANLPSAPPSSSYTHLRVYRRMVGSTDFSYVGQLAVGTGTFTDTVSDAAAAANPVLNEAVISGVYGYHVTYVAADGTESRPGSLSGPINVINGRVTLDNLPQADVATTEWRTRRIYRCLATDSSTFHLVGEIPNMNAGEMFVDNLADSAIIGNPQIDLDGPKIGYSTRLVDILSRDGSVYNQVFQEGTLEFTSKKGERSLDTSDFEITADTTVQELIDSLTSAFGILPSSADPVNPIPGDMGTGANIPAGGMVSSDGRIILTGNNGPGNAIDVAMPGLPFSQLQSASGEGTATDLMVFDNQGTAHQVLLTTALEARDATTVTYRWFAGEDTGRVAFDASGNIVATTNLTVRVDGSFTFDLDLSNVTVGESSLATAQDSIVLHGTLGDETALIRPGSAVFAGAAFEVHVRNIAEITVVGSGGIDVAELLDCPRDDHLVATPEAATLSGPGYRSRVEGFRTVHGYAREGGIDVAELFDGAGDDRFLATPTYSRLVLDTQSPGSEGLLRTKFFDYVHAYAKQGGRDRAYLLDSEGDDVFASSDEFGKLRGDGFQNRAKFFEHVSGSSSGGNDIAWLTATGDTHLRASGIQATLSGAGYTAVYHFDTVKAISTDASNTRDLEAIDYLLMLYGPWSS